MPVLQNCSPEAEGAFTLIEPRYEAVDGVQTRVGFRGEPTNNACVRETYHGRVLSTGERNGYDDSDFTVTVWDDEKDAPETFVYATTRAYTYHLYAHVDATPEIVEKLRARQAYAQRRGRIMARRAVSKARFEVARNLGVEPQAIRRLEAGLGIAISDVPARTPTRYTSSLAYEFGFARKPNALDRVLQLAQSFKAGRLRSGFKQKLAQQVIDWLIDPAPRYPTPLSRKQLDYV